MKLRGESSSASKKDGRNRADSDEHLDGVTSEMEMFKRLKRLEKFNQLQQTKAKGSGKPNLLKSAA